MPWLCVVLLLKASLGLMAWSAWQILSIVG